MTSDFDRPERDNFGESLSPRTRRKAPPRRVESVVLVEAPGIARGGDGLGHPLEVDPQGRLYVMPDEIMERMLTTLENIEALLTAIAR